jgi:hypothetical protein
MAGLLDAALALLTGVDTARAKAPALTMAYKGQVL